MYRLVRLHGDVAYQHKRNKKCADSSKKGISNNYIIFDVWYISFVWWFYNMTYYDIKMKTWQPWHQETYSKEPTTKLSTLVNLLVCWRQLLVPYYTFLAWHQASSEMTMHCHSGTNMGTDYGTPNKKPLHKYVLGCI